MVFNIKDLLLTVSGGNKSSPIPEHKTPSNTAFLGKKAFGLTNPFESEKKRLCPNYRPCTIKSRMTEFLANLNRVHPTHRKIEKPCPPQVGKVQCKPSTNWPPARQY